MSQNDDFSGIGQRLLDTAPVFERVERIRERLKNIAYTPDPDPEFLRDAMETGTMANFAAGFKRPDEMVAFDEMMIEMRVPPGELFRQCRDEWFEAFRCAYEAGEFVLERDY